MKLKTYLKNSERGTAGALADKLGISPSYLSQLASGRAPISPQMAVAIELHTNGAVARQESREDWQSIWPELADKPVNKQQRKEIRRKADIAALQAERRNSGVDK